MTATKVEIHSFKGTKLFLEIPYSLVFDMLCL